jgi:hypothetical protein
MLVRCMCVQAMLAEYAELEFHGAEVLYPLFSGELRFPANTLRTRPVFDGWMHQSYMELARRLPFGLVGGEATTASALPEGTRVIVWQGISRSSEEEGEERMSLLSTAHTVSLLSTGHRLGIILSSKEGVGGGRDYTVAFGESAEEWEVCPSCRVFVVPGAQVVQ